MLVDPSQFDTYQTATRRTADLKYRLGTHHGLCPSRTLYVRTQALLFIPIGPSLTLFWLKVGLNGLDNQVTVPRRVQLACTISNYLLLSLLSPSSCTQHPDQVLVLQLLLCHHCPADEPLASRRRPSARLRAPGTILPELRPGSTDRLPAVP